MKIIGFFVFIVLAIPFGGLLFRSFIVSNPVSTESDDYYYNPFSKAVYYSQMGNWFELSFQNLPGVFKNKLLTHVQKQILIFDNHFYLSGNELQTVRVDSGIRWELPYIFSSNTIYFVEDSWSPKVVTLEHAEMTSFQILSRFFAKDRQKVYLSGRPIQGAEPATFAVLPDSERAYDEKTLYIRATDRAGKELLLKIDHQGTAVQDLGPVLTDGKSIFYVNYRANQIEKKPVQNLSTVRALDTGFTYDGIEVNWKDLVE